MTYGIHHITAISSNVQKTYDFYTKILGLRLVKKTVNFDSPYIYHLYFGNELGNPGTLLTFFVFENAGTGMRGVGQVTKVYFSIPKNALGFWLERFTVKGVKHSLIQKRFGEPYITFYDFDGLQMELVGVENDRRKSWTTQDIASENAIRGFYGAELSVDKLEETEKVLKQILGYEFVDSSDLLYRYVNKKADYANILDIMFMQGWPEAITSAGTNHHIAFRVNNESQEKQLAQKVDALGLRTTNVVDRQYFKSIYFREPNNILFELATEGPGFEVDEKKENLGTRLKLPSMYEPMRKEIESRLTPFFVDEEEAHHFQKNKQTNEDLKLFKHIFINNSSTNIFLLLHGTGGDEHNLVWLAQKIRPDFNILGIKGNVSEDGMARFFTRNQDGSFDLKSIETEVSKLDKFLKTASKEYKFELKNLHILGYSNGANFGISYLFKKSPRIKSAFLLHPQLPFTPNSLKLEKLKVIITYGKSDNYSTSAQINKLKNILEFAKANVQVYKHSGGHEISKEEVNKLVEFGKLI